MAFQNMTQAIDLVRSTFSPVSMAPLTGPDNMTTPHFGLFRMDDGYCFPISVKSAYKPHTTQDIVDLTTACLTAWNSTHQCRVTPNWGPAGHRVIIGPSKNYRRSICGTKDNIYPRAVLDFPFGGRPKFTVGMFRDVCKNLQIIRGDKYTTKFGHTTSGRIVLADTIDRLKSGIGQFDSLYSLVANMKEQDANVADFLAELYPAPPADASAKAKTQAKNRTEAILTRMLDERTKLDIPNNDPRTANVWELLNAVTGYVQHTKTRRQQNGKDLDLVGRAFQAINDPESDNVWDLAESLSTAS